MVQRQGGGGGGGGRLALFDFNFFKIYLHLEITLPFAKLRYAFEEKLFFSSTIILWKKVILGCLKMNLKI